MDRFTFPEDGYEKRAEDDKFTCPVCQLSPCSETCPIGFTQEELDELRDRLLGHKSKGMHHD